MAALPDAVFLPERPLVDLELVAGFLERRAELVESLPVALRSLAVLRPLVELPAELAPVREWLVVEGRAQIDEARRAGRSTLAIRYPVTPELLALARWAARHVPYARDLAFVHALPDDAQAAFALYFEAWEAILSQLPVADVR